MRLAVKIFPPKNLVYIILKSYFFLFPPLTSPRYCSPISYPPLTSPWYFSISYQMSLLLLLCWSWNPVDSNCWTWVVGPSFCQLNLVERRILILELRYELWGQGILTENFLNRNLCRRSVSNCWTLGCWAVVLSTRPRGSCWENNFGTPWWSLKSRNLKHKIFYELRYRGILTENILSPNPWPWIVRPRITDKFL